MRIASWLVDNGLNMHLRQFDRVVPPAFGHVNPYLAYRRRFHQAIEKIRPRSTKNVHNVATPISKQVIAPVVGYLNNKSAYRRLFDHTIAYIRPGSTIIVKNIVKPRS